jgi:hypothetical protein
MVAVNPQRADLTRVIKLGPWARQCRVSGFWWWMRRVVSWPPERPASWQSMLEVGVVLVPRLLARARVDCPSPHGRRQALSNR